MTKYLIREAKLQDITAIHKLCSQLNYEPSEANVKANIQIMLKHPDYEIVVIEDNGQILGWMSLFARYRIEDAPFLQIGAIVTDEAHRGKGLGKQLLGYAERRAREKSFSFLGMHSSVARTESHKFYEKVGYVREKESYFFRKDL